MFLMDFFYSIKEINRIRNEVNRLLSKIMPNIHLKVTTEDSFGELQHTDIIEFQSLLLLLKNQRSGSKTVCTFFIILILK